MTRTQIQLDEAQVKRLCRWARRIGISMSEAIRRCVEDRLEKEEAAPSRESQVSAALAVCGKYADPDGPSRVAMEHDRHLYKAYRS
jgi:hypothetical protein